jgi:hypothetical protein
MYATVSGGYWNTAAEPYATVGGGYYNTVGDDSATVAGGYWNEASGARATVGGGYYNTASGEEATVAGGKENTASGTQSTVAGGADNTAGYRATVGGGLTNDASGDYATVPGGHLNTASGDFSFAAGYAARALNDGSFVWADTNDFWFSTAVDNSFKVRSTGGVRFVVGIDDSGNTTWSCLLNDGYHSWSCSSDRNLKENFESVDALELLERLSQVPIERWNAKGTDPDIRHMGPMAQDFYAAFGLGEDDRHISALDVGGVALAAIQGLYQIAQEQEAQVTSLRAQTAGQQAEIDGLKQERDAQQAQIADLEERLAALERAVGAGGPGEKERQRPTDLPVGSPFSRLPFALLGGLAAAVGAVLQRRRPGGGR